jgi:hypothetical protein
MKECSILLAGLSSSLPDPNPIGSVDPDSDWESVSVYKKAKMTNKKSEEISRFEIL